MLLATVDMRALSCLALTAAQMLGTLVPRLSSGVRLKKWVIAPYRLHPHRPRYRTSWPRCSGHERPPRCPGGGAALVRLVHGAQGPALWILPGVQGLAVGIGVVRSGGWWWSGREAGGGAGLGVLGLLGGLGVGRLGG